MKTLKIKNNELNSSKNVKGINFYELNPLTKKYVLYGQIEWNGNEWIVKKDDEYNRMDELINETIYAFSEFLNKYNYNFYLAFTINNNINDETVKIIYDN